jgi:hypothetical protein
MAPLVKRCGEIAARDSPAAILILAGVREGDPTGPKRMRHELPTFVSLKGGPVVGHFWDMKPPSVRARIVLMS